ncbi:rLLB lysis inhibitor [Xanthomonas phage RiverRider]|uniref:RLLB lysis inhibitor n=1 Tax=Xanthomonas phage RiverRider TaxID=2108116 RepID=A0A2P1JUX6_9CAUD|nr:RIIB lysis inhibitor [Xanthomonas phage RiverRider]AVO23134.1 rLLB lysis inhibitor [Xanthomonas phage RiverRider]
MKITVVAAILKDDSLTLVTNEGKYHKLAQGDNRLRPILDLVLPEVQAGRSIEVDLSGSVTNVYEDFEKKSNGVVKFFRVARNALKKWFGDNSLAVSDGTYGTIPDTPKEVDEIVQKLEASPETREETLEEIIANSKPVTGLVFNTGNAEKELQKDETLIAVVDGKEIIPNAQHLHAQVAHASKLGSPTAFENFARLVTAVKRQHSMDDLVAFISKLDTPLTEDGYVLAYKNLSATADIGVYVDPYTKKVKQRVGTRVCMSESLVDPNRGQDCSNGLHVASRSYLGSYTSNGGTFLIRIKPSDVIAVPKYNTNKMRVCAYEILGRLNTEDARAVCSNRPMQTDEGKRLLAAAVSGKTVAITNQVEITASHGGGCIYTEIGERVESRVFERDTLEDLGMVDPIDPDASSDCSAPAVPVEEVVEALEVTNLTRKEAAAVLHAAWAKLVNDKADDSKVEEAYKQLVEFKQRAKVSWAKLGVPYRGSYPVADFNPDDVPEIEPAKVAEQFDQAAAPEERDEDADAEELNNLLQDFNDAAPHSKDEYEVGTKLIKLFKDYGFAWDEDGENMLLDFDEADLSSVSFTVAKYEQAQLREKLAPSETPSKADEGAAATTVPADGGTPRQRIRALLAKGPLTVGTAKEIVAIKKAAKKSWSALGVNGDESYDIEQQATGQ